MKLSRLRDDQDLTAGSLVELLTKQTTDAACKVYAIIEHIDDALNKHSLEKLSDLELLSPLLAATGITRILKDDLDNGYQDLQHLQKKFRDALWKAYEEGKKDEKLRAEFGGDEEDYIPENMPT